MPRTKTDNPKIDTRLKCAFSESIDSSDVAVRIGVIGCGYWGPNLIRNFQELPQAKIAAVSDLRDERLKSLARRYASIQCTTRYEDILRDPAIDAVVIVTPISSHYPIAKRALLAGKDVLIEKPLAATVKEGMALVRLARRCRKILMVGHTFEYNPSVLKVAELLRSGELGKPYYIDSVRVNLGLYQSDGLNVVWDLAPHDISIILHWLGQMPRAVSAWGQSFVRKRIADVAFLRLEFPGNVLAHLHVSWLHPTKIRRITLVADKKMVIFDELENAEKLKIADKGAHIDPASREIRVGYRVGDIVSPRVDTTEPLYQECQHFVDCILQHKTPRTDGENGVRVVRILEAADKSIKRGGSRILI